MGTVSKAPTVRDSNTRSGKHSVDHLGGNLPWNQRGRARRSKPQPRRLWSSGRLRAQPAVPTRARTFGADYNAHSGRLGG